jgi:hypothetical protein
MCVLSAKIRLVYLGTDHIHGMADSPRRGGREDGGYPPTIY